MTGLAFRKVKPNGWSVTGIYVTRTGRPLQYESLLERDTYLVLDFEPGAVDIETQPRLEGIAKRWTPDCMITTASSRILVEIKHEADLVADWEELSHKFSVVEDLCSKAGYQFGVMTDETVNRPEKYRVDVLKLIKSYALMSDEIREGSPEGLGDIIRSEGPVAIGTLAQKIPSNIDSASRMRAVCKMLASESRYTLRTPSEYLPDAVVSYPTDCDDELFSTRLLNLETLRDRMRTHPYQLLTEGRARIVS